MLKFFKVFLILAPMSTMFGCGHPADQEHQSSLSSDQSLIALAPLQANQLDQNDAGCIPGVNVRFQANVDGTLAQVELENSLRGSCEILLAKEQRSFKLQRVSDECGSKKYLAADEFGRKIEIADHSTRTCEDLKPFLIEIKELSAGKTTRYGGNWN